MHAPEAEDNFPVETNSRLIDFLQKLILISVKVLALLMTLVIIAGVIDVAFVLYKSVAKEPQGHLNFDEILTILGAFLVVLIAIEIFINIILYLRQDMSHLKLVLATALMAVSRKVIILDYEHVQTFQLFGMGGLVAALGIAYWLIKQPKYHQPALQNQEKK